MTKLPKNGAFTATYSSAEPILTRPSGYLIPGGSKMLTAQNLVSLDGEVSVTSNNWYEPAQVVANKQPYIFEIAAKIYNVFEKGFAATDFAGFTMYMPSAADESKQILQYSGISTDSVDSLVNIALGSSSGAVEIIEIFATKNFDELKSLAGDNKLALPKEWVLLNTYDPRVASYFPNSLSDAEAAEYAKLPKPITSMAIMDPTEKHILALYIVLDPDGFHCTAHIKYFSTTPDSAEVLKSFDVTSLLADEVLFSYVSFWEMKSDNNLINPRIVYGSVVRNGSNNQIVSFPYGGVSTVLNAWYPMKFSDYTIPLIPMQWIICSRLKKAVKSSMGTVNTPESMHLAGGKQK